MIVFGYLPATASAQTELLRATRLLDLEFEQALTERQVLRRAERLSADQSASLVVTTDHEIGLIRELHARAPGTKILLVTRQGFTKLPYYLSMCPLICAYLISRDLTSGAEYFVNSIGQIAATGPRPLSDCLRPQLRQTHLTLTHADDKEQVLQDSKDFFSWCLGETEDLSQSERVRHLCDSMDELLSNAVKHPPSHAAELATVSLAFDGTHIALRVKDSGGALNRERILETLSKDHIHLEAQNPEDRPNGGIGLKMVFAKQQRLIFHLYEGLSTEIICISRVQQRYRDRARIPAAVEIYEWA